MESYALQTGQLRVNIERERISFAKKAPGIDNIDVYNDIKSAMRSVGVRSFRVSFNQGKMPGDPIQVQLYRF